MLLFSINKVIRPLSFAVREHSVHMYEPAYAHVELTIAQRDDNRPHQNGILIDNKNRMLYTVYKILT